jgi:hypothetical protein
MSTSQPIISSGAESGAWTVAAPDMPGRSVEGAVSSAPALIQMKDKMLSWASFTG